MVVAAPDLSGSRLRVSTFRVVRRCSRISCATAEHSSGLRSITIARPVIATSYWAAWSWQWPGTHLPPSPLYPAGIQGFAAGHACCATGALVVGVHPVTMAVADKPTRPANAREKARISNSLGTVATAMRLVGLRSIFAAAIGVLFLARSGNRVMHVKKNCLPWAIRGA
jgi:hypothetical protein